MSVWYDKHLSDVFLFNFEHGQEIISAHQPNTCSNLETKHQVKVFKVNHIGNLLEFGHLQYFSLVFVLLQGLIN